MARNQHFIILGKVYHYKTAKEKKFNPPKRAESYAVSFQYIAQISRHNLLWKLVVRLSSLFSQLETSQEALTIINFSKEKATLNDPGFTCSWGSHLWPTDRQTSGLMEGKGTQRRELYCHSEFSVTGMNPCLSHTYMYI